MSNNIGSQPDCENRLLHLEALIDLTALVNSSLDIHEIKKRAIDSATMLTGAEAGSLLFLDAETGELYFDVATGEKGDTIKTIRLQKGQGIAGWVAENHLPMIIENTSSDPRFCKTVDETSGFATRNMICVPVGTKERLIGVLQIINKREGPFTTRESAIMATFAHQLAITIDNAKLHEELKETFYETIHAFAETIELRDPYTGGHTRRVMEFSIAIAIRMGLPQSEREKLRLSAILHDIGKIGVPDPVLLKPGRLDPEEAREMMKHSEIGADMLSRIKKLKEIIPGIKHHHERFDGRGYPSGLKGKDIPIIARIITVADAFDAMTTDRPYRKGLDFETAVDELKKNSGTQFDPDVIKPFLVICKNLLTSNPL